MWKIEERSYMLGNTTWKCYWLDPNSWISSRCIICAKIYKWLWSCILCWTHERWRCYCYYFGVPIWYMTETDLNLDHRDRYEFLNCLDGLEIENGKNCLLWQLAVCYVILLYQFVGPLVLLHNLVSLGSVLFSWLAFRFHALLSSYGLVWWSFEKQILCFCWLFSCFCLSESAPWCIITCYCLSLNLHCKVWISTAIL